MITALYHGIPVEILDHSGETCTVARLDGKALTSHYVGGQGHTSSPFAIVQRAELESIARIDLDEREPYQNWKDALEAAGALDTWDAAYDVAEFAEHVAEQAQVQFIEFIHTHSLQKSAQTTEIAPNSPRLLPAANRLREGEYANVHPITLAVHG